MHIKKLEISGFKSFVDRTVVHFDHDVVGIVGPNGCGKSNIVDAVRWCMGEQSAKHLRGKSMEDVIFNGSDSRGQHGMAEVTLTFDNSEPTAAALLPPEFRDYPEIAISRRLFRDGTSEYLINRTQVRLRDVTDLFLGTGVGTKAYSIVEQGRIGQIVSARPEDRRIFIEEAAGVTKYKQRRKQAERKMELTRQNLLRVTDILNEVERNRNALKRQVAKAERYLRYRAELEDLELHEASHQWLEYVALGRVASEGFAEKSEQAGSVRTRLDEAEGALEAARREASVIETRADAAAQATFNADNEVSGLHSEIARARDRLGHLTLREQSDQRELKIISEQLEELAQEQASLATQLGALEQEEQAREADASGENDTLAALRAEESTANAEVQSLRDRSASLSAQAAAEEARLDGFAHRVTDSRVRRDRVGGEIEQLGGEIANLRALLSALERSVSELAEGKRLTVEERESLEQEMQGLRLRLLESDRVVDGVKNELVHKRNRLRALSDLHRRLEGVGAGVRALLSRDDPTVLGMFADRIEVPEELTAALTGLLGDRLQYVIVSDPARGVELLDELRSAARGRAHVVAARPFYVAGAARRPVEGEGIVGTLADLLRYDPRDEPLVRALVGDAVVVRSAPIALELVANVPGTTAVALDGTVVRPNGVVSGGSGDDVASAMVEQKREMRTLAAEVERLGAEEQRVVTTRNALRARMTEVGTSLDRAREGAHEGEVAHIRAEKDLARTRSELDHAERRSVLLETEARELDETLRVTAVSETEAREQLDAVRTQFERLHHELAKAEERATERKERSESQAALVADRRVRLAQIREQLDSKRVILTRVLGDVSAKRTRGEALDQELLESAAAFGETAGRLMVATEARDVAAEAARAAHQNHREAEELRDQIRNALGVRESELRVLREQLTEFEDAAHHHEMELQRIQSDHEHLVKDIQRRFRGLQLARVIGDYHARPQPDAEHRRRIGELAQLIDRMGPVNLDARGEYEESERRFESLSQQHKDIEQALVDLERAIKHMNRESRRRFKETYEAVNDLFKETFRRLFRGGRAELRLTNPEDMLETGVDIIAQPPGKKLGNIELMSGGEKALTAVALIFAIFQHKPSPFCFLDEVDAPLDDANVTRYNEAIRSMTDRSQFILITHIKTTMQSVDVLYGVTMGEPGVSRIVSVKVNDRARPRSSAWAPPADQQATVAEPEAQSSDTAATQVA
jgi:chromosome segregation protein